MKILLVEDSRTSVLLVETLLREDPLETYDLFVADTLAKAKTHLAEDGFDLILLDLNLPDSAGLGTVDSIVEVARGTGIVVLTSTSDEQVGLAALRRGAQDFLVKDETYRRVLLRAVKYARQRSVAEREIREAKEVAEFATRSKSSFIANLSHEFRTPLNAVIGFSELMLGGIAGDMTDKQLEYARDIHKSGCYLLGLIGTVLDISKIEADKLELRNGLVDMGAVIADVIERVRGAVPNDKISLKVDVAEKLPRVFGDHTMVVQIVTNLITNAFKYSPDGGEVSIGAALDAKGDMLLVVQDHGIGIPKEEIGKVFEPFERTAVSRERRIEGTGLGMALTKGLVEAHQGVLAIDSDVGRGTTVTVRLPSDRLRR